MYAAGRQVYSVQVSTEQQYGKTTQKRRHTTRHGLTRRYAGEWKKRRRQQKNEFCCGRACDFFFPAQRALAIQYSHRRGRRTYLYLFFTTTKTITINNTVMRPRKFPRDRWGGDGGWRCKGDETADGIGGWWWGRVSGGVGEWAV